MDISNSNEVPTFTFGFIMQVVLFAALLAFAWLFIQWLVGRIWNRNSYKASNEVAIPQNT